ncbi:MAG: hypothetical protein K2O71_04030, partial [Lachnospiraceae bacterium]|nr:hypothetical protein [Lachnospiraceae bacterium]
MRITSAPENANAVAKTTGNKEQVQKSFYQEGQIIEGTVVDVDDKVSIDFSGRKLSFPKESVPDAARGQVRRFQVLSSSPKGIALKEVGAQTAGNFGGVASLKVDNMRILAAYEEREESEAKEEEEGAKRITGEDYEDLCKENYTLE